MPRIKKQTEHNLKLELQLDFPNKHRLVSQLIVDKEEEKEEKKASTYFHFLFLSPIPPTDRFFLLLLLVLYSCPQIFAFTYFKCRLFKH